METDSGPKELKLVTLASTVEKRADENVGAY
jgi:hypothetical protein